MEFRNRVILLCSRTFDENFWFETRDNLVYLYGREILTCKFAYSPKDSVIDFLFKCKGEHFLDFIEIIFKYRSIAEINRNVIVDSVNTFLNVDNLPYSLTEFVSSGSIYHAGNRRELVVKAYPRVIRRESTVVHSTAIEPTIKLLENPIFSSANSEFLEALSHYRKGEYPDCISKCGSSFESVMKVICERKKWSYNQTDTAGVLLENILDKSELDGFFKQPLMLISTIRNRLSSAHGAGTQQRVVPKHIAHFTINATASAILLLVDETNS